MIDSVLMKLFGITKHPKPTPSYNNPALSRTAPRHKAPSVRCSRPRQEIAAELAKLQKVLKRLEARQEKMGTHITHVHDEIERELAAALTRQHELQSELQQARLPIRHFQLDAV